MRRDPRYSPQNILIALFKAVDSCYYSTAIAEVAEQSTWVESALDAELQVRTMLQQAWEANGLDTAFFITADNEGWYTMGLREMDEPNRMEEISALRALPRLSRKELDGIDRYVTNEDMS